MSWGMEHAEIDKLNWRKQLWNGWNELSWIFSDNDMTFLHGGSWKHFKHYAEFILEKNVFSIFLKTAVMWVGEISLNALRPRQNDHHFPEDSLKWLFLNENAWIPLKISLKFVPKFWIKNIPAFAQIMVWRRPGDNPLSEPIMISLLTHICATRPQWVFKWKTELA